MDPAMRCWPGGQQHEEVPLELGSHERRCTVSVVWLVWGCADPCVKPYRCPPPDTVYNCMPVVDPGMADLCGGECGDWIREHCPDVEWTY